ncbi:hypothetical protein [Neisseria musculi]|uniref:hypothetical protein n=1 Tax=Neisseria musculi TaxID=1815583 RepID=UPI00164BB714|nr:hypothetical protein [Neisseria musculi]
MKSNAESSKGKAIQAGTAPTLLPLWQPAKPFSSNKKGTKKRGNAVTEITPQRPSEKPAHAFQTALSLSLTLSSLPQGNPSACGKHPARQQAAAGRLNTTAVKKEP